MIALYPNQKIKYPHAPPNGEAVANVSAKYRVYCRPNSERIARCEKNFDELLRVPRVHKSEINIHRAIDRFLVAREKPFRLARTIEHFVKRIGSEFAAEHGEKNAAAKNWIDEPRGIACKQPAVAVQSCAAIGKIRFHINLRDTTRVCHSFRANWLLGQLLLQQIFTAPF